MARNQVVRKVRDYRVISAFQNWWKTPKMVLLLHITLRDRCHLYFSVQKTETQRDSCISKGHTAPIRDN